MEDYLFPPSPHSPLLLSDLSLSTLQQVLHFWFFCDSSKVDRVAALVRTAQGRPSFNCPSGASTPRPGTPG